MKIRSLKIFLFSIFCLLTANDTNTHAQIGTWKTYFAYQDAKIVVETPHLVFAVYDGSLISYNPVDEEVKTYTFKEGLNDVDIKYLAYSSEANALVIVYANGNIDIFVRENEVYNLPFILSSTNYLEKKVYNLELIDGYAYISTQFGIVVVDVKRKEVKTTYNAGAAVNSVCRDGDDLYAATTEGVKVASISANLLDPENWKAYDKINDTMGKTTFFEKILKFKGKFIFTNSGVVVALNEAGYLPAFEQRNIRQIKLLNDQLILLGEDAIYFYSDLENFVKIPISAYSIDCRNSQNIYWIGAGNEGLAAFSKQANTSDYTMKVSGIKFNSPQTNGNFFMTFSQGKLLVTGGGRVDGSERKGNKGVFMVYEKGKWFNFDPKEIEKKTGLPCLDLMSAVVDPRDPNHYFVSSYGEGIYEFQDNQFVKQYSLRNSSLQSAMPNDWQAEKLVRTEGLAYDKNNNLYIVNTSAIDVLAIYSAENRWNNYYYQSLSGKNVNQILIDRNNQKWMNIWRTDKAGIVVLNENNTIGNFEDDMVFSNTKFTDQVNEDVSVSTYTCMAEDQNGIIWVGTDNGPIYFYSAQNVANSSCNRIISTDEYGSNFYLMENIKVTAIAVDGGNRKWMGTESAGVFVLDQSDATSIKVDNYTRENSLLISDNINSIAINDETGEVFIGTDKGLCSYLGEATAGKPDYSNVYAYPNPVRPSSNNQVTITGLQQNSTVKITDLSGNLIKQGKSLGGQFTWNCTDRTDNVVKAGIYLVFAATAEGTEKTEGVVTKIMVIK